MCLAWWAEAQPIGVWNTTFGTGLKSSPSCRSLHSMLSVSLPYEYFSQYCDVERQSYSLLFVFGGFALPVEGNIGTGHLIYSNDLDVYDVFAEDWYSIHTTTAPAPRGGHGATLINGSSLMLLFGGTNNTHVFSDSYVLDTNINVFAHTAVWNAVNVLSAERPPARWGHAMFATDVGVVVFGGFTSPLGV